jgi:hypothetical protein
MIEIDFFYRPLSTTDEPRRGKITVETARYDEARRSYFSLITITDPINIAKEFIGVDPLNTLEQTMCFFHTYMTSAGYQFWRWERFRNGDFRALLPA